MLICPLRADATRDDLPSGIGNAHQDEMDGHVETDAGEDEHHRVNPGQARNRHDKTRDHRRANVGRRWPAGDPASCHAYPS